jgi:hypothetical protein
MVGCALGAGARAGAGGEYAWAGSAGLAGDVAFGAVGGFPYGFLDGPALAVAAFGLILSVGRLSVMAVVQASDTEKAPIVPACPSAKLKDGRSGTSLDVRGRAEPV